MRRTVFALSIVPAMIATSLSGGAVAQAASSPNVVGQKYSDASAALSEAGFSPVVSSTVGSTLQRPECIVTHQQDRTVQPPPNSQWNGGAVVEQTLVTLNCNALVAAPGTPGNSLASPEGHAAATSSQRPNTPPPNG